jgi:hypothetical protein
MWLAESSAGLSRKILLHGVNKHKQLYTEAEIKIEFNNKVLIQYVFCPYSFILEANRYSCLFDSLLGQLQHLMNSGGVIKLKFSVETPTL